LATPEPQAVVSALTEAAIFLVLIVEPDGDDVVRELLPDVEGLRRSVGFRVPEGELTCVIGLGSELWDRLFGGPRPAGLHPLPSFAGDKHEAVATPGDLLFHIRAHRFDLCFELAQHLTERLADAAHVIDEVHGFRSFDMRDVLGFVDGTENPEGEAAVDAVLIGDEDPEFAGGSYVVVQKYVHELGNWDALPIEEQERVIGRTKLNDIELSDELKPANSHVALNTITDEDGEERQIVRFNMPFGRVGTREFGTYFIGYARDPDVIEQMLTNMFVGDPPGNYDRILDFSRAITSTLFYVPSLEFLDDPPQTGGQAADQTAGQAAAADAPPDTPTAPADGSLGIGSLK
jgi:putative iron-dependent peroxidase